MCQERIIRLMMLRGVLEVAVRVLSKLLIDCFYSVVGVPKDSNQLMYPNVGDEWIPHALTIDEVTLTYYHIGGAGDRWLDVVLRSVIPFVEMNPVLILD
jgi:hypothetical protein